jgi:hypothetical protein
MRLVDLKVSSAEYSLFFYLFCFSNFYNMVYNKNYEDVWWDFCVGEQNEKERDKFIFKNKTFRHQ